MSRRAAANAADLKAEEAKKLLRVTILRGPSNESLVNIYAAGKLPIQVDYLIAEGYDGSVIAERNEIILALRPGDNVTVTPGWLDPGLEGYNNDFWRMRREVRSLILHTSDGNTFYASWGPWNKEMVIASGGRGGGGLRVLSAACTVSATVGWNAIRGSGTASQFNLVCDFTVDGGNPPDIEYSIALKTTSDWSPYPWTVCANSGVARSNSFTASCYRMDSATYHTPYPSLRVEASISIEGDPVWSSAGNCRLNGLAAGRTSCAVNLSG
jgi:hypothetical protein